MKKINNIYLLLIGILILTISMTWNGIISMLKASYGPDVETLNYKKYSILNNKYNFSIPSNWKLSEQSFSGGEIRYHGDFISSDERIRGIVQVWDINMPLGNFLEKSKESITGVVEFKNYIIRPIKEGTLSGYLLEYSRLGTDNKYYNALEYFIQDGNGSFFRLSFYIPSNLYTNKYKILTEEILSTLKIN